MASLEHTLEEIAEVLEQTVSDFRFVTVRCDFRALTPLLLPPFKGSTFRGALGWALRRTVCLESETSCQSCEQPNECLYPQLFRTDLLPRDEGSRRDLSPPAPFVLVPPLDGRRNFQPEDTLRCCLTLIGSAIEFLPHYARALSWMGERGMGWGKGRCRLERLSARVGNSTVSLMEGGRWLEASLPSWLPGRTHGPGRNAGRLTLYFSTPLRLTSRGHLTHRPDFQILIQRLLERVSSLLNHYHGGCPRLPFASVLKVASQVQIVESDLQWFDWTRYSTAQATRMKLGGLIGRTSYEGPVWPFLSLLRLAESIHLGKQATFGLGQISLIDDSADSLR